MLWSIGPPLPNTLAGPMIQAPQLAPYAQTMQLDGVGPVFYYDSQSARLNQSLHQTVILIHGLQDEADSWRHVFVPLAQRYRVLALDLPGFGRSDKSQRRYSLPFFANSVLQFMDALKIMHATLIGNSMGAMTAELVALLHPARVSRLVLIDGTLQIVERPRPAIGLLPQLFPAYYNRKYFALLRGDPQMAYNTLRPYYADLDGLPQADQDFLYQRVNERVWDERQRLAALSVQMNMAPFFITQLPSWQRAIVHSPVPTQVIWGAADAILSLRNGQARVAQQRLPAQLTIIPNSGHLPHQETPDAVLSILA